MVIAAQLGNLLSWSMSEVDKQNEFVKTLVRFFTWLDINGYQITLGEAYRPPQVAKMYALERAGIANSRHCDRMAIDLNLFKRGVLLTTKEELRDAGTFWESLSTPGQECCWGGFFEQPDCDHFSIADGNRK